MDLVFAPHISLPAGSSLLRQQLRLHSIQWLHSYTYRKGLSAAHRAMLCCTKPPQHPPQLGGAKDISATWRVVNTSVCALCQKNPRQ